MTEITVVHLLRHGEVHNPDHVLYGRLPGYHLSANGRMMAAAAADFFAGRPVAAVFASPLERAQETAQPVAERLGLTITTDDRLIESANVLEGKSVSLASLALNPLNWRYLWNPFRPSWGEPYTEVVARVRQVIDRARDASAGPGGGLRQPPAADLGQPPGGRAQAPVAQPEHPPVRARVASPASPSTGTSSPAFPTQCRPAGRSPTRIGHNRPTYYPL